ncbi:hypothetical protein BDZ45DRAFT_810289 [Acephala macrosclerotiorum]|nr:hypothetical protein BDZ45DRAFT_810289 [Acephala macrosclerotiorum]
MNGRTWDFGSAFPNLTDRQLGELELMYDEMFDEMNEFTAHLAAIDGVVQAWDPTQLAQAYQPEGNPALGLSPYNPPSTTSDRIPATSHDTFHAPNRMPYSEIAPDPQLNLLQYYALGNSTPLIDAPRTYGHLQQVNATVPSTPILDTNTKTNLEITSPPTIHFGSSSASPAGHGTSTDGPSDLHIPTMTILSSKRSAGTRRQIPVVVYVIIRVSPSSIIMRRCNIEHNQNYSHVRDRLPHVEMPPELCPPKIKPNYPFPDAFLDLIQTYFRNRWNIEIQIVPLPIWQWRYNPYDSRSPGCIHYLYCFLASLRGPSRPNDPAPLGLFEVCPHAAIMSLNQWPDSYKDGIAIGYSRFSNLWFLKVYTELLEGRRTDHVRCTSLEEMERNYGYWR